MENSRREIAECFRIAFKLEKEGRFADARVLLEQVGEEGLADHQKAQLWLRLGALDGFLHRHDESKLRLKKALAFFIPAAYPEEAAECNNYLAMAFQRCGDGREKAQEFLQQALDIMLPETHYQRLYSHIIGGLLDMDARNYVGLITRLSRMERDFLASRDNFLLGSFYGQIAIARQELSIYDEATKNFETAYQYFKRARNKGEGGRVSNNLAQAYRKLGRFEEAHACADEAIENHRKNKDIPREASSLDTKANIYYDDGLYEEAHETILESLKKLEGTGNHFLEIESRQSLIKILIALGLREDALQELALASHLARLHIDEKTARRIVYEANLQMEDIRSPYIYRVYEKEGDFPLHFPLNMPKPEASQYFGAFLRSDLYESLGYPEGMLLIIAEMPVETGDFIGVLMEESEKVRFGHFTSAMGMIAIEIPGQEPMVLSGNECRILGKVIGIGKMRDDGRADVDYV